MQEDSFRSTATPSMLLRYLLSNWLHGEVARRAQDAFSKQGAESPEESAESSKPSGSAQADSEPRADAQAEPEDDAQSARCQVGVVVALSIEAGAIVDRLQGTVRTRAHGFQAHVGKLAGRRIVVAEAGAGQEAAARATRALITGHHPRWIISAGFAGGLDEKLAANDIVVADSVVNEAGERMAIDLKMPAGEHLHVGRLLTVDRIIHRADEKKRLGERHAALAADMETFAVAAACREEKVPFLAVRVISDTAAEQLPGDIEHLMRQKTLSGKLGAVTGSVFRRPSSVKDMWKLKERAIVAGDRLDKFLAGVIEQLVPAAVE